MKTTNEYGNETTEVSPPLRQLFLNELGELHSAEKKLALALPIVAAAHSKDLKALLKIHLADTKGHVKELELVAEGLGEKLPSRSSKAMTGLIEEAVGIILHKKASSALDAGLIAAAQKIVHCSIASYGTVAAWAKRLGFTHEYAQLMSLLQGEKFANALLNGLAKGGTPLKTLVEELSLHKAGAEISTERHFK